MKKLNDKGIIDIQLSQLGIKKPFTARHYYIKEQVEVPGAELLTQHSTVPSSFACVQPTLEPSGDILACALAAIQPCGLFKHHDLPAVTLLAIIAM